MAMQLEMYPNATVSERGLCHILVADDDPSVVQILQDDLGGIGYMVHCAFDGQAALQSALQYRPNLIIMDINMPLASGLKVLEALRARPDTCRIPVIFVSGEPPKDIYRAIASTARVAHVTKPFDLESLNSLVQLFLDQYPTA
jgi:CheY-like chemotaxis protein